MKIDLTPQDGQILLQLLDAAGKHVGLQAFHDCHRFAMMIQTAAQAEQEPQPAADTQEPKP